MTPEPGRGRGVSTFMPRTPATPSDLPATTPRSGGSRLRASAPLWAAGLLAASALALVAGDAGAGRAAETGPLRGGELVRLTADRHAGVWRVTDEFRSDYFIVRGDERVLVSRSDVERTD